MEHQWPQNRPPNPPFISIFPTIQCPRDYIHITFDFENIILPQSLSNCIGIFISNCPSAKDAYTMMTKDLFLAYVDRFKSILFIKVEMKSWLEPLCDYQINTLMSINKRDLLITFASQVLDNQLYWRFQNQKIFSLKIPAKISNFMHEILSSSMSLKHNGISIDSLRASEMRQGICALKLQDLADVRDYDPLMLASEYGEAKVVDYLIADGHKVEKTVVGKMAVDLAWTNGHYLIVDKLIKANSRLPKNLPAVLPSGAKEIREYLKLAGELHESIQNGKAVEVSEILSMRPHVHMRHFYARDNVSAAARAINSNQIEIYELLLMKDICIGPNEDTEAIYNHIDDDSKERIRRIHLTFTQPHYRAHLLILNVNSTLGLDVNDDEKKEMFEHIRIAYEYLNDIGEIEPILKYIAATQQFRIVFDFKRDNINHLDPTESSSTRGCFYKSRIIYVSAMRILDPRTKNEAYGTLAHEIMHYVLYHLYDNEFKPYSRKDRTAIEMLTNVENSCRNNMARDKLISIVFSKYSPNNFHAELIARVPQMIVEYSQNERELSNKREIFFELFYYYISVTMVDIGKKIRKMQAQANFSEY